MCDMQIYHSVTGFLSEKNSNFVDYVNQKLNTKTDTGYIKTATKLSRAKVRAGTGPKKNQTAKVKKAITITTGTK